MNREELRLKCLELSVDYIKQRNRSYGDGTEQYKIVKIAREFESYITEPSCNNYESEFNAPTEEENNDLPTKDTNKNTRRMTYQELAFWLRSVPTEFREYKIANTDVIRFEFNYREDVANKPVDEGYLIRTNFGDWIEPIVKL